MYEVDEQDVVVPFVGIPPMSPGAPEPVVVADEHVAVVAYYAQDNVDWRIASPEDLGDGEVVVLRFDVKALMFGPPNDESLSGHPLASRALTPYAAFRVEHSSWVRRLDRMNSVHPYHDPSRYSRLWHFIVTFHDSTLECLCEAPPSASMVRASTPRAAALAAVDAP